MNIAAICDKDTGVALRLAGIQEVYIPEERKPIKIWNELTDRNDLGVVFITEKIVEDLGKNLKDYRLRENFPIVVEIPDKKGRREDHTDFISHLVKKTVGVRIDTK